MDYPLTKNHGLVHQERLAVSIMQPHRVEQIVRMARARQRKLMRRAEDAIEFGDPLPPDAPAM
jgi:hypothetical protein